jgi:hypothetical protein
MVLERIVPKLGPLPELRKYKCLKCGTLVKHGELDRFGKSRLFWEI